MSNKVRLIGGPGDGGQVATTQEHIVVPLDAHLNLTEERTDPYAVAMYRLEHKGAELFHRFVKAERRPDPAEGFDVEFIDGPMQGVHRYRRAVQLHDAAFQVPLDAEHKLLEKGFKVAATAEYRRRKIDGIWKMTFVGIAEGEQAERHGDMLAEGEFTKQLEAYTSKQLIQELVRRPTFFGLILYLPDFLPDSSIDTLRQCVMVASIQLQMTSANKKTILSTALKNLEGPAG
jgi:hypothetical protein